MKDKYGRTLVYLYREPDGLFLNEELVKDGYAWVYLRFPFQYSGRFKILEEEARSGRRGLWKKKPEKKNTHTTKNIYNTERYATQ